MTNSVAALASGAVATRPSVFPSAVFRARIASFIRAAPLASLDVNHVLL